MCFLSVGSTGERFHVDVHLVIKVLTKILTSPNNMFRLMAKLIPVDLLNLLLQYIASFEDPFFQELQ